MKTLTKVMSVIFTFSILIGSAFAGGGAEMGEFYAAPDGVKVIYGHNTPQYGNLYRVSTNLYVQTKDDAYLADIKLLIQKLKISPTGREVLRQIATYTPVNAPEDTVAPLIEHLQGVDTNKVNVVTVIREPESAGRLFETVPSSFVDRQKSELVYSRQFDGKGVSNTVFFSTQEVVNIPGTDKPFDQVVALGHELIHARDYASGAMPPGSVLLKHRHPETGQVTEYSIENAEYQTTGIFHYNNAESGRDAETAISAIRSDAIMRREEMYFRWKSNGQNKPKAYLKNEKVVSEFHLADDLGAYKRNTYWPAGQYQYHPYTVEVRPAAAGSLSPKWNTLEGKQAHVEVRRALNQSLSEGKETAIVLIDATEQRLSQSLQHSPALTRRGLGNQSAILNYAAKNNIKVVNAYSSENETPLASLKKKKRSRMYRAILGQPESSGGYKDVQFSLDNQSLLSQELEGQDTVLVMAYSDGQMTTNIVDSLSDDLNKQVLVSRHSNLDYQPSNLSVEESTAWLNIREKQNVKMLGSGSRSRFNICSIQ
ncbi:M91 family zinc metallopeptidase [Vibrio jasicida]|uniref:M91 family zinc metallopeptidase n=1 Tax=Vibrio jasicida TaxID=766224 RepID=UPI0005EEF4FA|nr:M91 family zinc metallopeptidase [Vibrio jasicida]